MTTTSESNHPTPPLPGGQRPLDLGVSSLGLLMQLGGLIGTILAVSTIAILVAQKGQLAYIGPTWPFALLGLLAFVRGLLHHQAGTQLLYGADGKRYVNRYVVFAFVHSALLYLALTKSHLLSSKHALSGALVLLAWPLAVAILLRSDRAFRQWTGEVRLPVDLGFESTSILMLIFGGVGAGAMALVGYTLFKSGDINWKTVPNLLVLGSLLALLGRSLLHAHAGSLGVRGARAEVATQGAQTYTGFAIASSIAIVGLSLTLAIMTGLGLSIGSLLQALVIGGLLLAWPLVLRRFVTERNFSMVLDENITVRRASDTGLTALGWLSLTVASHGLAQTVAHSLLGDARLGLMPSVMGTPSISGTLPVIAGFAYYGLQGVVAWSLITMHRQHRTLAAVYGAAGSVAAIYLFWPSFGAVQGIMGFSPTGALPLIAASFGLLVLPAATCALVFRPSAAEAKATIRA